MSAHSHVSAEQALRRENIAFAPGSFRIRWAALIAIGVALSLVAGLGVALGGDDSAKQRLGISALHVGFMFCLGISLGALVLTMMLHQVNAGWAVTTRRVLERTMTMFPVLLVFATVIFFLSGFFGPLWKWMSPAAVAGDVVYEHKASYLNTQFFFIRAAIYFVIWIWLARSLQGWSLKQDETGDPGLTQKMRRRSSYGLLLFALTTAFASFDWLMSLDYHWFSTMFGVYYFAGAIGSALALTTLALILLRRAGKLDGLVSREHFHDYSKLLFGFTVFWAYVSFSQYFLIWYANIPEETAFFMRRRTNGWEWWSFALSVGRFIVPFFVLMPRPWRRAPSVVGFICVWILAFQALDVFWIVRPEVYEPGTYARIPLSLLDVAGVFGPILIYLGVLAMRITSGPLTPMRDPRLPEALVHKNYV